MVADAETGHKGRLSPHQGAWLCFLALICPCLTVGILEGYNGVLTTNILLTLLGWIPGMIHAYYVVGRHVASFPIEHDPAAGGTAVRIIHKLERGESGSSSGPAETHGRGRGQGQGRRSDRTVEYEYVIEVGGQRYVRAPREGVAPREPERITITHQRQPTSGSGPGPGSGPGSTPVRSHPAGSGVASPRSPGAFARADDPHSRSHSGSAQGSQQGLMSPVRSEGGGVYSYGQGQGQAMSGQHEPAHVPAPAYESQHGHGHGGAEYQYGQKGERKDGC